MAKNEIEIYLKYGVVPLIENYFGSAHDCAEVLEWMHSTHPEMNYGVNILGDRELAFELAHKYGAKFIQIDSVCGHLKPKDEHTYVSQLQENREKNTVAVLGGVLLNTSLSVQEDPQKKISFWAWNVAMR